MTAPDAIALAVALVSLTVVFIRLRREHQRSMARQENEPCWGRVQNRRLLVFGCLTRAPRKQSGLCLFTKLGSHLAQISGAWRV